MKRASPRRWLADVTAKQKMVLQMFTFHTFMSTYVCFPLCGVVENIILVPETDLWIILTFLWVLWVPQAECLLGPLNRSEARHLSSQYLQNLPTQIKTIKVD